MMAGKLSTEIRQSKPFASLEEEAFLALQRSAALLLRSVARELEARELTPAQHNTLRILRGAGSDALTCGEIGERLVSPGPDVTRLLDRLEKQELVQRLRDEQDRRVVRARITEKGVALLEEIDPAVDRLLRELLGHVGETDLQRLIDLLERTRERA
jgi:DNA-binding MarR family transcriptional regulator